MNPSSSLHRAAVLSSICALAWLSGCKAEAPAAEAPAAFAAPEQEAAVNEQAAGSMPAPEPEPADAFNADPPGAEARKAKDSAAAPEPGAPLPGTLETEPIIQGNLDRDIIRRVVRNNVGDIRDCYDAGLRNNAALGGTLTIDFTIDANGRVKQSKPAGGEFEDPKVAQCIADAIANWEFPETGGEVTVSYPFTLDPG